MQELSGPSVTDILTLVLVIITGIYAIFTFFILKANQAAVHAIQTQVKAATRPYVHFDIVPESRLLEASLRNAGVTAALDVCVVTNPPLRTEVRGESKPSRLTGNAIAMIAPGREFREYMGSWDQFNSKTESLSLSVSITYKDSVGNNYKDELRIDLTSLGEMPFLGRPNVPHELKNIAENLGSIHKVLDRIRADNDSVEK